MLAHATPTGEFLHPPDRFHLLQSRDHLRVPVLALLTGGPAPSSQIVTDLDGFQGSGQLNSVQCPLYMRATRG